MDKTNAVLELTGHATRVRPDDLCVDGSELGAGYGMPTEAMVKAVRAVGSAEGILVDPVYGGKALAGMLAAIKAGCIPSGSNVLFMMTGGSPGLNAYQDIF